MLKSIGSFSSRRKSNFHSPSRTAKSGSGDSGVPRRSGGRRQNSGLERLASEIPNSAANRFSPSTGTSPKEADPEKLPSETAKSTAEIVVVRLTLPDIFPPISPRPQAIKGLRIPPSQSSPFEPLKPSAVPTPASGPLSLAVKIKVFPRKRGSPFTRSNRGLSCTPIVCKTA